MKGTNLLHQPEVRGIVLNARDISRHKSLEQQLVQRALHDQLTGLPNRMLFMDRLEQALERCARRGKFAAVLFLDLDRFKLVNDNLGHDRGDQLLVQVAERLRSCLRRVDTIARIGGDEFTVLLEEVGVGRTTRRSSPSASSRRSARRSGSRARRSSSGASIGIALGAPDQGTTAQGLLRNADIAMYRAKANGRACFEVFKSSMRETVQGPAQDGDRAPPRARPGRAPAPLPAPGRPPHLPHRRAGGPGALGASRARPGAARVLHPDGRGDGPHPADRAVGARDRLPAGGPLAGGLRDRPRAGDGRQPLAAAVPPPAAGRRTSGRCWPESGLDASGLEVEITEGTAMGDADATVKTLEHLKAIGIRLAIDDFGTGYSSLGYLKRFPIDVLKVDRSFVAGLPANRGDAAIVRAVVGLTRALGLKAVAEGVETADQLAELRELGCDQGQGYFFGRPTATEVADAVLRRSALAGGRSGLTPAERGPRAGDPAIARAPRPPPVRDSLREGLRSQAGAAAPTRISWEAAGRGPARRRGHGSQLLARGSRVPRGHPALARGERPAARSRRRSTARRAWHRKLYEAGYVGMGWPKEYGGPRRDAHGAGHRGGRDGARRTRRRRSTASASRIVGPTIIVHGTEAQKQRYLKKILTAEEIWCQLYSEPNAGSDLASLQTRAEDRGRPLRGQRPEDLDERRPHRRLGAPARAHRHRGRQAQGHLVLPDHHAPARRRGAPAQADHRQRGVLRGVHDQRARREGGPHRAARRRAGRSPRPRSATSAAAARSARVTRYAAAFHQLVKAAQTLKRGGRPLLEDPVVRAKLGRIYAELEVQRYAALRVLSALEKGESPGRRRRRSRSSPTPSSRSATTSWPRRSWAPGASS